MIKISDENSLGYSYYLEYDDDDDLYYYYDDDDDDDDYDWNVYLEDYVVDYVVDYTENYLSGYSSYYYPSYVTYYEYDDDDDDYYYNRRNRNDNRYSSSNRLTINGDTLKVGSSYDSNIWLNNNDKYSDIRVVDARNNGKDIVIAGNSRRNSLISGDGDTTLYGAAGSSNTLIGGDGERNVFWYTSGSTDYAVNFITGDGGDSDIVRLSEASWSTILRDDTGIVFNMTDGNFMRLQLKNSNYDDPVLYTMDGTNINKMKITRNDTNTLTYRQDTNYYYFSQNGQLNVNSSGNTIWLGGEGGQNFVNVNVINASSSYGSNVLMGNVIPNMIYGGSGYTTMWGGSTASIDTLVGGQGVDNFMYGRTEGNDIIYTDDTNDVINLYNSTLSDITYANVDDYGAQIGFNTGEILTLHNSASATPIFQFSDGSRYNYNRSTKSWQNA